MASPDSDVRCGAKNRQGQPCGQRPMKGKRRCAMHGGKTPKGTRGNRQHGIYSAALTDEELDIWPDIVDRLGSLDDEIHLTRVQLRRAFVMQRKVQDAPADLKNLAGIEIAEVRRSSKGHEKATTDVVSKRTDFHSVIDRLSGRLSNLEKTRAELLAAARESGDDAGGTARDLVEALKAMRETERRTDSPGLSSGGSIADPPELNLEQQNDGS